MTSTKKITDFVSFNPKRTIKKGETKPFVEMAALPVDSRDISEIGSRTYKGGGSRFQDGDTLFARITPCLENGKTAKASGLGDGVIAHGSTEFIVLAAKEPEYDEDYVYYLARMPEFRAYAQSRMEGTSGRQRVSWRALAEFEFDFPDKEDRKEIGRILKSIDDKIQVNNQLNQTLEQIAQAIFKSWFVDFEPVKAKIAVLEAGGTAEQAELAAMSVISAKDEVALQQLQAEQPDAYNELAQTAALFPAAMEESELGEIPEGWGVKRIGGMVERFSVGKKYSQKTASEKGSIPILDQGKSGIIGYHSDKPGVLASPEDPIIVFANHTCYMRLILHDFSAIQNVLPFKGKDLN
ncbi:restriction endonuclease subunit S, partial [Thiolapillus sp.]